jgi:DNA-binding XRE family transcriptional regulator
MHSKFWDNVRELLKNRKEGQKWLAEQSGVGRTAINNGIGKASKSKQDGEKGIKNSPSVDNAYAIAKVLSTTIEELVDGKEGEKYLQEYVRERGWEFSPPKRIAGIVKAVGELSDEQLDYVMGLIKTMLDKKEASGISPEIKSKKKTG